MTSISGSMSPVDRIQQALQSAVSAGTVNSADQSALSNAITDIDSSLQSGASSSAATSPGDMKSKVDGLVDQEVSNGKLTSDQATELKQVFAQATQHMGGHHGHHMHASGSDSGSVIDQLTSTSTDSSGTDSSSTSSDGSGTSSTSTSNGDSLTQSIQTLMAFLQKLESATSGATNYNSSGTSASSLAQNLLVSLNA